MARHLRRLRLSLQRTAVERARISLGPEDLEPEDALVRLLEAIGEEAEVEAEFASAFDGMVLSRVSATTSAVALGASPSGKGVGFSPSTKAVEPAPQASPALVHALECMQLSVQTEIKAVAAKFKTISGSGMRALQALLTLRSKLAGLGLPSPLPSLDAMCEIMAEGWCAELPELLQTTLNRALGNDDGEPIDQGVWRTSSAVDVRRERASQPISLFAWPGGHSQPTPPSALGLVAPTALFTFLFHLGAALPC